MRRRASPLFGFLGVLIVGAMAAACGSSTAPKNLTGPYVGSYTMDSVTADAFEQAYPPHGTLDSADGVQGVLTLKSDSFYIVLSGTYPKRDSGRFAINSSNVWTLSGSFFSGTGSGALIGNNLEIMLTGGAALGKMYGLFTQQ